MMHYVSAEGITKSYGITPLFRNISFHINEGDKIGIIARNGIGKSTLLRILAGHATIDEGKLWVHKDVTVALFEQEPTFEEDNTVLENIFLRAGDVKEDNRAMPIHPVMNAIRAYEAAEESGNEEALMHAIAEMDELN